MTEKAKSCVTSSTSSTKSRTSVSKFAPSSTKKILSTCIKDKSVFSRNRYNKNLTICEADETGSGLESENEGCENNLIDYGKFLRNMLEECLIDEKIKREESQMEIQILRLSDRFNRAMDLLDKTSLRLRQILFVIQQKRLLDIKKQQCTTYYNSIEKSNASKLLGTLRNAGQDCLDTIEFRNVDFGYDEENGYQQLSKSVDEVLKNLDQLKKHNGLEESVFEQYKNLQATVCMLEKHVCDFQNIDSTFRMRFPNVCHKVIKDVSNHVSVLIESDEDSQE